jgi:uncharacterized caspase-like protein
MRDKLKKMDFDVIIRENMKARDIGGALREFRSKLKPGSIALFFYAGHGLQIRGENYLPAVDAEISSEEDVPHQSLNVNTVLNTMEDSKPGSTSCCSTPAATTPSPVASARGAGAGLARIQAPSGTLIHYATRPGSVAEDGDGVNGTYTAALLAQIEEKGVPIEQALKRVTVRVKNATKGKQEPWMEGQPDRRFLLHHQRTHADQYPVGTGRRRRSGLAGGRSGQYRGGVPGLSQRVSKGRLCRSRPRQTRRPGSAGSAGGGATCKKRACTA